MTRKHRHVEMARLATDPTSGVLVTVKGVDRGATRDASARMRPDHLAAWLRAGVIGQSDFDGAREVEVAFGLLTNPVSAKVSAAYEGGGHGGFGVTDYEPEWQRRLQERYTAWAKAMQRLHAPIGPILDICCDGLSFTEVSRKYHWRNGRAKDGFVRAMSVYLRVKQGRPTAEPSAPA